MTTKTISLTQLDARAAGEAPFEFEYQLPNGTGSGVFLSVLGAQSRTVQAETNRLVNERRNADIQREAMQASIGAPIFSPVEQDIEFGQRLAAIRLVGWRGITEPWSAELALQLIKSNAPLAEQVTKKSAILGNFPSGSPKP